MGKRVLVILGHPSDSSLCAALADACAAGAEAAGHEVRRIAVGRLHFDPLLRNGYATEQVLESDLIDAQQAVAWAQHIVWVYPIWWGAMPAVLKGFVDRTWLPGFAFRFQPGKLMADPLLAGRSAQLLVTMDTPPWYYRWVYRMPGHQQMKRTILEFCGIRPVTVTSFGPVRSADAARRRQWLAQARACGARA